MASTPSTAVSQSRVPSKTQSMAYIALFAVLIAVCSWISIPTIIPFTLQTFAVTLSVGVLGGRRGTLAVLIYLLLGAVGVPVFAGFSGGLGAFMGPTGGYLAGFIFTALVMWGIEALLGNKLWVRIVSMVLGLAVMYAFGTVWFMIVWARTSGPISFGAALLMCVVPYLIPEVVKTALSAILSGRLRTILKLS